MATLSCPLCATPMHVNEDEARDLDLRAGDILDVLHKGLDAHLARFCLASGSTSAATWNEGHAEAGEDSQVPVTPASTGRGTGAGRTPRATAATTTARPTASSPVLRAREA